MGYFVLSIRTDSRGCGVLSLKFLDTFQVSHDRLETSRELLKLAWLHQDVDMLLQFLHCAHQ